MEEWIGQWWHRAITHLAEPQRTHVQVALKDMQRSISLLYRAGGGDAAVRVTPVAASRHGGPRHWLQKVAGSGLRSAMPELDAQTLALPPVISVFDSVELNRDLYLWLAALASVLNLRATGLPITVPLPHAHCSGSQGYVNATTA